MYRNAKDIYFESRVLSAEPVELVRIMYQAAIAEVRKARGHLASGDIARRSRAISKACEIVIELTHSLDRSNGGDLAARLGSLYEYIHSQLLTANMHQADQPLVEALGLLTTLGEAWDGIGRQERVEMPVSNRWGQAPPPEPAYTSHAWSL